MKNVMDYGKARGMTLVGKYLPKLNPFQSIDLIGTMEEWGQVRYKYGDTMIHRIDYPIGHAQVKQNAVQGTNGFAESIPELISAVRKQGNSGVVLIAQTTHPSPPRYLYLGGFNILFCLGSHVVIELVGKAFDGHELTQGLGYHEQYCLNWDDIPFVMSRNNLVRRATSMKWITVNEYQIQRHNRIQFLDESCHYPLGEVESNVPEILPLLDDSALRLLLDDIVVELRGKRVLLEYDKMRLFGVQGNVVEHNGQIEIQPWEIFCPERWS